MIPLRKLFQLALIAGITSHVGRAQHSAPGIDIICYSSPTNSNTKLLAPVRFYQIGNSRIQKNSTIEVNYVGFTEEARTAFQFAVDIWESFLHSPVPIRVTASWSKLGANVLGSAGPARFFSDFEGAPLPGIMYPVALAERLARGNLNPDNQADINANFNSDADWYFGTDGNTPQGQTDLVSVVMHEIGHGLGMVDTFNANATSGIWGTTLSQGLPVVYDYYVVNGQEQQLIDTLLFPNPGGELKDQLTSSNVFFSSDIVKTLLLGAKARLFAPNPFNGGSSIAHLDEANFPAGNINSLMTPQIGQAEAIHIPGDIVLSAFAEMGWFYSFIDHQQLKDTENTTDPIAVIADISSDTLLVSDQIFLSYSTDNFENSTVITMMPTGSTEFMAQIPPQPNGTEVSYFLSILEQGTGRQLFAPPNAPESYYSLAVGVDTEPPHLQHLPPDLLFTSSDNQELVASVTDNLGVGEVLVEYKINDGPISSMPLLASGENAYSGEIDFSSIDFADGDIVHYRIIARDLAASTNVTEYPSSGFDEIQVAGLRDAAKVYSNNLEGPTSDFAGRGFNVSQPAGFDNLAIHSLHPYGSVLEEPNSSIYLLKIPILIDTENPTIKFDEIVLVEPGQPAAAFGSNNFKDFVVVEGSKDDGITWQPFEAGYDASTNDIWLQLYNSDLNAGNSNASGSQSLYQTREISLSGNSVFRNGDEVLIRFRLFDDAMDSGWGWAIDNISIQEPVTSILSEADSNFRVYPNPSDGNLNLKLIGSTNSREAKVIIHDNLGKLVFSSRWNPSVNQNILDIKLRQSGIFILQVSDNREVFTFKIIVK